MQTDFWGVVFPSYISAVGGLAATVLAVVSLILGIQNRRRTQAVQLEATNTDARLDAAVEVISETVEAVSPQHQDSDEQPTVTEAPTYPSLAYWLNLRDQAKHLRDWNAEEFARLNKPSVLAQAAEKVRSGEIKRGAFAEANAKQANQEKHGPVAPASDDERESEPREGN